MKFRNFTDSAKSNFKNLGLENAKMKSEKGPHIFWWLGSDRGWDWCLKVLISAAKIEN